MARGLTVGVGVAVLVGVLAGPVVAQESAGPQADELRKELQSLREMLEGIQKDIKEIKANMARPPARRSPVGETIDFGNSPFKGDPSAKVTLIEVSDYQCPFCGRYTRDTLPLVEAEYIETGKVKSVFLDLPLESIHKFAFKAAEAARCAGDQGKYWEMHDRLFANQKALEPSETHAEAVGLDVTAFDECMTSGKHADEIRKDMAEANRLGITGTPGFLLGRTDPTSNKVRVLASIRGARPFADFKREIDKLLGEAERAGDEKPAAEAPSR